MELMNSLVDVVHNLHDNLDLSLGIQENGVHFMVPMRFRGVHPRDHIHPNKASVVAIAHKELQVLQELECKLRCQVLLEVAFFYFEIGFHTFISSTMNSKVLPTSFVVDT